MTKRVRGKWIHELVEENKISMAMLQNIIKDIFYQNRPIE